MATKKPTKRQVQPRKKKPAVGTRKKGAVKKTVKRAGREATRRSAKRPSAEAAVAHLRSKLGDAEYEKLAARARELHAGGVKPRALGRQLAREVKAAKLDAGVLSTVPSSPSSSTA